MSSNTSKNILVVEDDVLLGETISSILADSGFIVKVALDGVSAKSILEIESFDLIVSDIRMPNSNGIQLLHYVKKNKKIPMILMTGFSEIAEAKEAYELGAVGFLAKPFKIEELLALVQNTISATPVAPTVEKNIDRDSEFTALRIEEFVSGKEILFDIYIRISNEKYIKVATSGDSIDINRVLTYQQKGITHLYLKKEDFRKYVGFTTSLAKKVAEAQDIDHIRKLKFLTQTSAGILKNLYLNDLDQGNFQAASDLVLVTVSTAAEQPDAMALIDAIKEHGDNLYKHSMAVSVYSVLLAKAIGWGSPRTAVKLGLCGLFHDIGKKEVPLEIIEKPRIKLKADEIKLLESHPRRGLEILSLIEGLPEEVALSALQHHEDNKGSGYPARLSKSKITPFSRVIALVNKFCELVFKGDGHEGMTPQAAYNFILINHEGMFDNEFLDGLAKIFKIPTNKEEN